MFNTIKLSRSNLVITAIALAILSFGLYSQASALGFTENFSTNPLSNGWSYTGSIDTLFVWDSVNQNLHCRWNPSTTLSQFSRNPGISIGTTQSFRLEFDLFLNSISNIQSFPTNPLAIGFLNSGNTGNRVRNIIEFDYYTGTDTTFGGPNFLGVSAINTSGDFMDFNNFRFETPAYTLSTGTTYHVKLLFDSSSKTMTLAMKANGSSFGVFNTVDMSNFPFIMDKFSITNWFDGFNSFLIDGTVDNIILSDVLPVDNWMKY